MRRRLFFALLPIAATARAQTPTRTPTQTPADTPAERASRLLQQGVQRDRAAEAGGAEGPRPAEPNAAARAIDSDRRSIEPDVGRPEESGAPTPGGERAATGGGQNPQR